MYKKLHGPTLLLSTGSPAVALGSLWPAMLSWRLKSGLCYVVGKKGQMLTISFLCKCGIMDSPPVKGFCWCWGSELLKNKNKHWESSLKICSTARSLSEVTQMLRQLRQFSAVFWVLLGPASFPRYQKSRNNIIDLIPTGVHTIMCQRNHEWSCLETTQLCQLWVSQNTVGTVKRNYVILNRMKYYYSI
jgi:hypothetical protein